MGMRNTGNLLNARVIETWISDTLGDAEHLDIPGVILKPAQKPALERYGISRLFLHSVNVPVDMIDRIYRGLFVYSIGFYEMLNKALMHAENKYTLLSSVWKVFSILLEYCCKSNYQMLISKISTEHQQQMEQVQEGFHREIEALNRNEKDLKFTLDEMQRENGELRKRLDEEVVLRIKLQEEIYKNIKSHEEEVQLRLQFESKLNGLHSLHRDLQAKYERALEDIYNLEFSGKALREKFDIFEKEVIELRAVKIENDSRIAYLEERIKSLQTECDQKVKSFQQVEQKILRAQEQIEEKNLLIKD